jgi:hypothetical protein
MSRRLKLVAAGLISSLSCASEETRNDSSTGVVAASAADLAEFCEARCARSERCTEPDDIPQSAEECRSECSSKLGTQPVYRVDVIGAMRTCLAARDCQTVDDICTNEAIRLVSQNPTEDPSFLACYERHEICDAEGDGGFSDDLCGLRFFLVPEAFPGFDSCLTQPCAEILTCSDALLGRVR